MALPPYNMSNATIETLKSQVSQSGLVHSKLRSITPLANKVQLMLCSFAVLTCMSDTIELVWHACHTMDFEFILLSRPVVKKKNKNKKVTLHILTHGAMRGCGLTSWVICIDDKICDTRERNETIRSEIWTTNIRWNIREWLILWGLTLWSSWCIPLCVPDHKMY